MSGEHRREETSKGKNMPIAVHNTMMLSTEASGRRRKRSFDYCLENDFDGPTAKKNITEDDMSRYLGRLRLASDATRGPGAHSLRPAPQDATYRPGAHSLRPAPQDATHRLGAHSLRPAPQDATHRLGAHSLRPAPQDATHRPGAHSLRPAPQDATHRPGAHSLRPAPQDATHRPGAHSLRPAPQDTTHGPGAHSLRPAPQDAAYEPGPHPSQLSSQDATQGAGTHSLLAVRPAFGEELETLARAPKKKSSPQKRSLDDDLDGRMDCDYDCDYACSDANSKLCQYSSRLKRFRLDGVSSVPLFDDPSKRQFYLQFGTSTSRLGIPTLVPPCDIYCAPETSFPATQVENVTAATDDEEEEGGDVVGGANESSPPIRLWIAPEVQSLCTDQKPFLPSAVMNEIRSQGMELVPYVGPPKLLLHNKAGKDRESTKDQVLDATTMDLQ